MLLLEVQITEHCLKEELTNQVLPYAVLIAYANTADFIIGFADIDCELCDTFL